jgi:LuxR family transcriptional regulator, maltose regulon positive regulatory protein
LAGGTATTATPGRSLLLRTDERAGHARGRFEPSFPLVEAKLHPPALRPDTVYRAGIAARLTVEPPPSVVSIVAPPGYGKTTFLAEWASREERRVAWLTLDGFDNEPSVFLTYLAAAIDRIQPIDGSLASAISAPGPGILGIGVPRLASELHRWPHPGLLILDDVHVLVSRTCLDALTALLEHLPPGFQVALAGRSTPDLPLARMRARQSLLEIGRRELAFDVDETAKVVRATGQDLSPDQVRRLADRTEGWPAAIYLASLTRHRGEPPDILTAGVSGRDGYIADYLRSELDPTLDDADVVVLTRASILDVIEVPASAAVTGLPDAGDRLRALARRNGLIVRVGGTQEAYRYHHLLRDYLQAELDRREPGAASGLHGRAAAWFADAGRAEEAVEHAIASGDPEATARLFERAFVSTYYGGHADRLGRWLRSFDEAAFERRPSLAIIAAWIDALSGRPESADHNADIVERSESTATPADGTASFGSSRAMLRAAMARSGPEDVLENATIAAEAEHAGSAWRATALWLLGGAHMLRGDVDTADLILADAVAAAPRVGTSGFYALALRASLAIARGDWPAAERFARESRTGFERTHLDGVVSALMVHAVSARVAIHRGDLAWGNEDLVRAQLVRPLASYALPWGSTLAQLEMARAYLAIGDPAGARSVVSDAEQIVRRRPRLGVVPAAVQELRRRLDVSARTIGGPSTLTPAEMRVLPFLSTHLRLEEIGDRLHVSRHTVKTHTISIYGKLGATSRGEAVERAVEIGLLEPYFGHRPMTTPEA